jgi:hypothetical protein
MVASLVVTGADGSRRDDRRFGFLVGAHEIHAAFGREQKSHSMIGFSAEVRLVDAPEMGAGQRPLRLAVQQLFDELPFSIR